MINDLEQFVSQLELALNERDKKIKKRDELVRDVNDLCHLFPELEQVIADLEKKYEETQDKNVKLELEILDQSIRLLYENLSETESNEMELEEEIDVSQIMSSFQASKKSELEEKKEALLKEIHQIEMEKGRKCYLKFSYQGVRKNVSIPRRLKGKYCRLLTELHSIDRDLERFIPQVSFDKDLYQTMTLDQQRGYLANIMLQIEARSEQSFNKVYVNQKYIPYEYKTMYLDVLHLLKEQNQKKTTYYHFSIDHKLLDNMSLVSKLNYFDDLCRKIVSHPIMEGNEAVVTINNKTYKMNQNDKECFLKAYQYYVDIREEIEKEIQIIEQKNEVILKESATSLDSKKVFIHGKNVLVLPEHIATFVENNAYIKSAQSFILKDITFDLQYYNTLSLEDRITYCESIIQDIREQKIITPSEVMFGDRTLFIDSSYKKTFAKVNALLMTLRKTEAQKPSISIDEEYVKTLSDSEKLLYYQSIIRDICAQPIERPFETTIKEVTYRFDESYKDLFYEVLSRYQELSFVESEPLEVKSVRKSSRIKELASKLKKKFVYVAIGVVTLTLSLTALASLVRTSKYQNISIHKETEALSDDSITIKQEEKGFPESVPTDSIQSSTPLELNYDWNEVTNFSLNQEDAVAPIYSGDLDKPLTPLYPNDSYRVVSRNYVMPDGSIQRVNLEDEDALSKISQIEAMGGVIQTVGAVAKTGEEDYAKNHIPTGNFVIDNSLIPNHELDEEITDYLNQGRGR